LTASAGDVWLADRGDETRRRVFIVSDARFHRLADRAVVAPLLDEMPGAPRPWHVPIGDRVIAANQLGTLATARLLELVERSDFETLRQVRRAVGEITN